MRNRFYHLESHFDGWPIGELKTVLDAVEEYRSSNLADCSDFVIYSVEKNLCNPKEKNDRADIEVRYMKNGQFIQQKLLMMKGRVIDGVEFHARHDEFYPGEEA